MSPRGGESQMFLKAEQECIQEVRNRSGQADGTGADVQSHRGVQV